MVTSSAMAMVAATVGVAGVSLAVMSDDRHGSRALHQALADLRGSAAKNDPLSAETIAAVNAVQEDRAVTRARQALTLFRKKDEGYALARVIARNMIVDLLEEMAVRHQQGRKIAGPWLDGKLALKKYQRVTFTDLFGTWATLTAEKLDAVR
jgi:hypothetical protein